MIIHFFYYSYVIRQKGKNLTQYILLKFHYLHSLTINAVFFTTYINHVTIFKRGRPR